MANKTLSETQTSLSPREWLGSFILHAVIFALIFWLTPLHDLVLPPEVAPQPTDPPASSLSDDPNLVREAIERIEETQASHASEQVNRLLEIENELGEFATDKVKAFNHGAEDFAATAPQTALAALQKVPPEQDAVKLDQDQLTEQIRLLATLAAGVQTAENPEAMEKLAEQLKPVRAEIARLQDSIKKHQIAAEDAQGQATQTLSFVASSYADPIEAQKKANAAQNAASDTEQKAIDTQKATVGLIEKSINLARMKADADAFQATVDEMNRTSLPTAKQAYDAEVAKLKEATRTKVAAEKAAKANKNEVTLAALQNANAVGEAQKEATDKAKQAMAAIDADRQKKLGRLKDIRFRMPELTTAVAALPEQSGKLEAMQKKATDDQAAAHQEQAGALSKLASVQPAAGVPVQVALEKPDQLIAKVPEATEVAGKNLADLYQFGKSSESRVAEKFKIYRAAELAAIRKVSVVEAAKSIQVAIPDREKLDLDMLAKRGAGKNFERYKSQVQKADHQLDAMVTLAEEMLAEVKKQQEQSQQDVKVTLTNEESSTGGKQQALADDVNVGKDLTVLMTKGASVTEVTDPPPVYSRSAPELPEMDLKKAKISSSRRIGAEGAEHPDWIAVQNWYLIGPFPNPGRRNLNTKYPPESIIDLDAVYPGKDNQPVRWQFLQWDGPAIRMPNDFKEAPAIYYAYTELIFDEARDLWVATGSDDKGTMWINNILVWNSNDNLKNWTPNEGYRKAHFIKGRNKILYRLENAQFGGILSLMISTKP